MHGRAYVWILGLPPLLTALLAAPSCGNSKPATGLGAGCSIDSDCNGALICAFGLCHVACVTSKDCTSGATCLPPGVCELPQETTCSSSLPCVTGLTCADDTCRAACSPGVATGSPGGCLADQTCSNVAGVTVCLDESGDGGGGTPDGSSGSDGSRDGADGSSSGGDGPCTSPETTFGPIAQGDSNPSFGSGVGALGPDAMYVFSGYSAPAVDGGTPAAVYVQAFDPKTGTSKGPSQSLFTPPQLDPAATMSGVTVYSSAASPTGVIALVYELNNSTGPSGLYLALLGPSAAGAGANGLQLQQAVLVNDLNQDYGGNVPAVFWSNATQTFVVSYQYTTNMGDWLGLSVNKYYVDGQGGPGGVSPAPFVGDGLASQSSNGNVGESGDLLGVSFFTGQNAPSGGWISILDESGNLVGSPTELVGEYGGNGAWVGVAGTAQGFVYFYDQVANSSIGEVFLSTSPDGGIVGGDISGEAGVGAFPGFSLMPPATAARVLADDVGTGGHGGVGAAFLTSGGVSFVYVNADGATHEGPVTVSTSAGGDSISMANLDGSFAVSFYDASTNSTRVVASGICP
jgi:hypothetical protein